MSNTVQVQHSFSSGEVSPLIHEARTDLNMYRTCLVKCCNYIPLPQGGLTRRPGISTVHTLPENVNDAHILMVSFGSKILIISDKKTLIWEKNKPDIIKETVWTKFEVKKIRYTKFKGVLILVHSNYPPVIFTGEDFSFYTPPAGPYHSFNKRLDFIESDNKWTISKGYKTRFDEKIGEKVGGSTGAIIDTVKANPWSAFMAPLWATVSVAMLPLEVLTDVVSGTRSADGSYLYGTASVYKDSFGQFEHTITAEQDTFKDTDIGRHITFECEIPEWDIDTNYVVGALVISKDDGFIHEIKEIHPEKNIRKGWAIAGNVTDLERYILHKVVKAEDYNKRRNYYGIIKTIKSPKEVEITLFEKPLPFCGKATTDRWAFGVWNQEDGYPSIVTTHGQRLIFSGYKKYPSRFDMSEIVASDSIWDIGFKYTNAKGNILETNAISLTFDKHIKSEVIKWISGYNHKLLIGTDQNEWECSSIGGVGGLSPLNFASNRISSYGSESLNTVMAGRSLLFLQKGGQALREISIVEKKQYKMTDILFLANHLIEDKYHSFNSLALQKYPYSILWATTNDYRLIGCTLDTEHSITAWHTHELGDGGRVHSVEVIDDCVYLLIERGWSDDSHGTFSIDKMQPFALDTPKVENNFTDNGNNYTSKAILPRIEEKIEAGFVGGKKRIVSTKIRFTGGSDIKCGCEENRMSKAVIQDGIATHILSSVYGFNERLHVIQNDYNSGTIFQVLMLAEMSRVQS